jgi:DNA-binding LacI/PurR family transcriptional regulator
VASRAGVSTATVSRALRGLPNVSSATRERVVRAASELGYVASPSASGLASGRTRTVCVVTPYVARWFFAKVLQGIGQPLRSQGYQLLIYDVGELGEDRRRAFDPESLRKRADAVLVLNVPVSDGEIAALRALSRPVALLGYQAGGFPSVAIDDVAAAATATRHLVELGHTRIAHIGSRPEHGLWFPTPVLRRRGYEQALTDAGLPVDPLLHRDGDFTVTGGAQAMRELLALPDPPTAVFAGCDEMAFGAMRTVRDAGLSVPADVSFVGIDDHEMSFLFDLTTVAQPVREQGELAARLLLAAMGPVAADAPAAPQIVVPTRLLVRASTGPPPAQRCPAS